jgi:hypothetical protein
MKGKRDKVEIDTKSVQVSPRGTLIWPWIRTPDTRFDSEGKYKVTLLLDPADAAADAFIKQINSYVESVGGKNSPCKDHKDKDGNDTDKVAVTFGSAYKPAVFDSHRNKVPDEVDPGNGSEVRVAYTVNVYDGFGGGVNLYLKAVQIVSYKPKEASASDLGFGDEEGWSPPPAQDAEPDPFA